MHFTEYYSLGVLLEVSVNKSSIRLADVHLNWKQTRSSTKEQVTIFAKIRPVKQIHQNIVFEKAEFLKKMAIIIDHY